MKLVRPHEITEAIIASNNVTDTETLWNSGTTYALDAIVRGTGANARKLFQSLQASNINHAVDEPSSAWWIEIGPTNRWAMFDGSPQSQTSRTDSIDITFEPIGRVDSVGLENIDAETAQIIVTDSVEGVVYDETFNLVSDSGITDWWSYYFEPIERIATLSVTELPPYSDPEIRVILADTGETVSIGELVLGLSKHVGNTQWNGTVEIIDYSRKEVNDFGVATIIERSYAKRATFNVWVLAGHVDTIADLLARYRATPMLFVFDEDYGSTSIYGFIREWSIEIAYLDVSVLTIEIEGLA